MGFIRKGDWKREDWPCNLIAILSEDLISFGDRPAGLCRGKIFLKISKKMGDEAKKFEKH